MKKIIFISLIFFSIINLSLFAQNQEATISRTAPAIMMQEGGALWMQNQNGLMIWNASLPAGTKVELYITDQTDSQGNPIPVTETAWTSSGNGTSTKNTFSKVRYQNSDFFIISSRLASAATTGKIKEACAVYTKLDFLSAKNRSLAKDTLISIGNTFPVTGIISMTEITYFDRNLFSTVTAYVLEEKVARDK